MTQWKPIESAPKDGTRFIGRRKKGKANIWWIRGMDFYNSGSIASDGMGDYSIGKAYWPDEWLDEEQAFKHIELTLEQILEYKKIKDARLSGQTLAKKDIERLNKAIDITRKILDEMPPELKAVIDLYNKEIS